MRNILLTTVTALLLASCGVYKPYSRPEEVKTDGLYGTDIQAEDTASIASLHWSELFTDTRLQSLIRRGLENNNDLNVARLKVVEAEATLMSSRLAYLPSVSLAPQGTLSSFDGSKTTKTYTLAASAEWELDLFGKLTNAKRGARAALEQSRAYRQAVQTQLIATIANSYYNLLMLDVQLDINRCTAESWSESLRTLELQKQFGNTTEAAVQQARANLLTVETNVLTLEQQVKKQEMPSPCS
jgi:multidrug efflux system outer membrane protein